MDRISVLVNKTGEQGFLYSTGVFIWNLLRECVIGIRRLFGMGALPDYIIIGAQKAGTSSLQGYISRHPDVAVSSIKEIHFFDHNFHKGAAWYRACFPDRRVSRHRITGEATPYYLFHPLAAERVHAICPGVKLIVLLRNPVDRAYSHYNMEVTRRNETLEFKEAVDAEHDRLAGETEKILTQPLYKSMAHQHFSYCARGQYADQLKQWLKYFPREQIMILETGELRRQPEKQVGAVFDFLGLSQYSVFKTPVLNRGIYKKPMDAETKKELSARFEPHNRELYRLLGTTFDWK